MNFSILIINYDKTTLYRVGSLKNTNARYYSTHKLNWTSDKINVLGVDITNDNDNKRLLELNYNPIIEKTRAILQSWTHRNLSLVGKVNVINTLVASLYVYKMQVLPYMLPSQIKCIEDMCQRYLWNNHKPKIQLEILQTPKKAGGLGLVNMRRKEESLKAGWVKELMVRRYPPEYVHKLYATNLGNQLWATNLHHNDIPGLIRSENKFWIDVLDSWCRYHYDEERLSGIIWLNSKIRINNKPILWKQQIDRGLMYVSDLMQDGQYRAEREICMEYGLSVMQYNSLKSAIPQAIRERSENSETDEQYRKYMATPKPTGMIYKELCESPPSMLNKEQHWKNDGVEMDIVCEAYRSQKLTDVAKFQSFQYRHIMRGLVLNNQLKLWKIIESDACSLCGEVKETDQHLFFECEVVQRCWAKLKCLCEKLLNKEIQITYPNIVKCDVAEDQLSVANYLVIVVKQYVYQKDV